MARAKQKAKASCGLGRELQAAGVRKGERPGIGDDHQTRCASERKVDRPHPATIVGGVDE